eukprot:6405337-Alexandrium_andersonii.AAC.1
MDQTSRLGAVRPCTGEEVWVNGTGGTDTGGHMFHTTREARHVCERPSRMQVRHQAEGQTDQEQTCG